MKIIGVTGGVGSGKSELLKYIKEHYNCRVLLADEAAHEVERPGTDCYRALVKLLGTQILAHGYDEEARKDLSQDTEKTETVAEAQKELPAIDKKKMAAAMFGHPERVAAVNAIVHPAVRKYIMSELERAGTAPDYFFLEAALLIECGYGEVVDEMWYIYCDPQIRRQRLAASRGYSQEKIGAIMQSQLSDEAFRAGADVVIDNSGPIEQAQRAVDSLLQ